jgi:hypothetical protein
MLQTSPRPLTTTNLYERFGNGYRQVYRTSGHP